VPPESALSFDVIQDLQPGLLDAFRSELRKLGYMEGAGPSIEVRNADGRNERLKELAEEMMRVADPVKSGLVASPPPAQAETSPA
jgi:hypothetical protein